MERKYRVKKVSGSSYTRSLWDFYRVRDSCASLFLERVGFTDGYSSWEQHLYTGAIPQTGREFYVYHQEPTDKRYDFSGTFRLVRKDGETEELIDSGSATKSRMEGSLNVPTFYLTFYGNGEKVDWSFYCEEEIV